MAAPLEDKRVVGEEREKQLAQVRGLLGNLRSALAKLGASPEEAELDYVWKLLCSVAVFEFTGGVA